MSERPGQNLGGLGIDRIRCIDAVRRRFERDRREGRRAPVDDYLRDAPEALR
jgi:hypothetical protein